MSDEDVDTFRDKIPLLQQRLASWEVEPPTIEPGLPRGEGGHFREGVSRVWHSQREVTGHED